MARLPVAHFWQKIPSGPRGPRREREEASARLILMRRARGRNLMHGHQRLLLIVVWERRGGGGGHPRGRGRRRGSRAASDDGRHETGEEAGRPCVWGPATAGREQVTGGAQATVPVAVKRVQIDSNGFKLNPFKFHSIQTGPFRDRKI
jgi:hypothetical protein